MPDLAVVDTGLEAEEGVLGACLVAPACIDICQELRLAPEHFAREHHRTIYRAICALYDEGTGVDALIVADRVGTEVPNAKPYLLQLAGAVPSIGNVRHYAELVIELARWRSVEAAGKTLVEAAATRDEAKRTQAERMLEAPAAELVTVAYEPEQLAERFMAQFEQGVEAVKWPWPKLDRATSGGMKPGQVTLIGGWTNFGKSIVLDQVLRHAVDQGKRAYLFINEMTPEERVARLVSAITGVSQDKLTNPGTQLRQAEYKAVVEAMNAGLPFGIADACDMTADEIARAIRRGRWDVVGVDIVHNIPHPEEARIGTEAALRDISQALNRAAKAGRCHVLATVHLNERRSGTQQLPAPNLGDIRGSGMLKNRADYVLFVHRDQTGEGDPKNSGALYFRKQRSGPGGGIKVTFKPSRMSFETVAPSD